jgi:hypothetical protein
MFRKVSFLFFSVALTSIPAMGQNNPPTTFTVPLASQAIINSLVGDGTTMTATCNTACRNGRRDDEFYSYEHFPYELRWKRAQHYRDCIRKSPGGVLASLTQPAKLAISLK